MNRAINVLTYTATGLVFVGLIAAMAGATMANVLFDVGMWTLIATGPIFAATVALIIVEMTPWHRRRDRLRFLARLDDVQRKARLSAIYRLRRRQT